MSTREHVPCPGCGGCLTCGLHTKGVTCNGTSSTPQLIMRPDVRLTDDQVAALRERLEAAMSTRHAEMIECPDVARAAAEAAAAVVPARGASSRGKR